MDITDAIVDTHSYVESTHIFNAAKPTDANTMVTNDNGQLPSNISIVGGNSPSKLIRQH